MVLAVVQWVVDFVSSDEHLSTPCLPETQNRAVEHRRVVVVDSATAVVVVAAAAAASAAFLVGSW